MDKNKYRSERRARGLCSAAVEYMSVESYARHLEICKRYNHSEAGRACDRRAKRKHREKCKKLYGGRPDQNIHARVKWLEAKS